jgi:Neprosin
MQVYPNLYSGSRDLRLFAGWTVSIFINTIYIRIPKYDLLKILLLFIQTEENVGCYSINCKGFVLSNVYGAPVPGGTVAPLSTFNGKDYFVTLSIKKVCFSYKFLLAWH